MTVLGYKTFHMKECLREGGVLHMEILAEAIRAQYSPFSGVERYSRPDFDKWLAEYDV